MERDDPERSVFDDDDLDDALTAADDTGLIRGEKLITEAEIEEAQPQDGEGNV